ncbi:MAG: type II toxin-antitoxin system HicA family toxin [Patescibacteria group bacterium]
MPKLPILKAKEIEKILLKLGFVQTRQKGSHRFFLNKITGDTTVLPMHNKDIGRGLLRKIINDSGVGVKEFISKKS